MTRTHKPVYTTSLSLFLALLLSLPTLRAADPISSVRPKEEGVSRILCYNVRNCRGMDNAINYDRVANVINTLLPDVVALQELDSLTERSGKREVIKELGIRTSMYYTYAAAIEFQGGKYGVGVLSKEKPLGYRSVPLPGKEERRVLLIVEFERYYLANCHLSLTEQDRVRSAEIISEALKELRKPVFLAGDMNSIPSSETQIKLRETFTTLNDTAAATIPVVNPNRCIDYIYSRRIDSSVTVVRRQIIDEPLASDHLPVCVDVKECASLQTEEKSNGRQTYSTENNYTPVKIIAPTGKRVKNVVLMIGDGMSLMHAYTAWVANKGASNLENCQTVGLSKTYCADRLITDSGAGGTAMATGQKVKYHSVGVDTLGKPLPTILDLAKQNELSTGVVVTCRLNDATPAAFCAHNIERDSSEMITADYVDCGVDFIFGGGSKQFDQRADGRDLFAEMAQKGYTVARNRAEFDAFQNGKLIAVVDSFDLPKPAERGDILAQASLKALQTLSKNSKGFVLMIEGSQLDDYGHFNDLPMLMEEVMDFDRTVGAVFDWAARNGETLVVVTADHETGGLTLVDGNLPKGEVVGNFSTGGHSGVMVPVYSFGPGADRFTGIFENTDIFHKIKSLLKLRFNPSNHPNHF